MSNLTGIPKQFNYSTLNMTGDVTLTPNKYNMILGNMAAPATLTLPALSLVEDGTPLIIRNISASTITVHRSDATTLTSVTSGAYVEILADKTISGAGVWRLLSGPSSASQLVQGPVSSTNTAVALWNGTTGALLQDSGVLVDGLNNMTGVNSVTLATTGGTPTALGYYEEFPLTGNTFTAAFAVAQACVPQITRVGRMVTMIVPSVSAAAAAGIATSSVAIPARFLPASGPTGGFGVLAKSMIVQQNSATATGGQTSGYFNLNATTGIITIGVPSATGPAAFSATNANGWPEFEVSWSV